MDAQGLSMDEDVAGLNDATTDATADEAIKNVEQTVQPD